METAYLDTECWVTFIVKTSSAGQTLLIRSLVCFISLFSSPLNLSKSLIMNVSHILPWLNLASFVLQLDMYGFHKIPHLQRGVLRSDTGETEYWNFAHENFRRDQSGLLCLIHRKKGNSNQVVGLSWLQKKVGSWTERPSTHGRLAITTARHSSKGQRLCFCPSTLITFVIFFFPARYDPHDSRTPSSHDPPFFFFSFGFSIFYSATSKLVLRRGGMGADRRWAGEWRWSSGCVWCVGEEWDAECVFVVLETDMGCVEVVSFFSLWMFDCDIFFIFEKRGLDRSACELRTKTASSPCDFWIKRSSQSLATRYQLFIDIWHDLSSSDMKKVVHEYVASEDPGLFCSVCQLFYPLVVDEKSPYYCVFKKKKDWLDVGDRRRHVGAKIHGSQVRAWSRAVTIWVEPDKGMFLLIVE